ncbi:MAG: aspartate--tRNA ligase [Candidatus Sungbacteria bacterium]|nr:aspartate--tRNA ligase [Candidatus Sungbacteria bacterium]
MRTLTKDTPNKIGETVLLKGWISARRDHGKLIFLDLRDRWGYVQVVFTPGNKELLKEADRLRPEWVIALEGKVNERPKGMQNSEIPTGTIEIEAMKFEVLSEAKTPPLPLDSDGREIDEETRLQYRYLDLRRARMQKNILLRYKVATQIREFLNQKGFVEIETPLLTKTSPEGARDFLVPSRKYPGMFFALPQSPQQYKQLLMLAGFEQYYQIARCLRDEDLRGDRQYEHTQIDMEMSFVTEKEVRAVVEEMMIVVAEECGKKILNKPFPVFTHEEVVQKFGADKFDMRTDPKDPDTLAFAWVVNFPLFEKDGDTGRLTFAHNPFSAPRSEDVEKLMRGEDLEHIHAQQYDLVCNGFELASGGVRISNPDVQRKVFEIMGLTPEQTEERFGHIIKAYEYGAPPHAGMAPGLDRLVMILAGETSIAEVIAFPKTGTARDPMMNAPSEVDARQLAELGIQVHKLN